MTSQAQPAYEADRGRPASTGALSWPWPVWVVAAAMLGVLALYWQTLASMVSVWANSDTYGYGFIIAPVSLYLVWQKRQDLARMTAQPLPAALALLLPLGLLWLLSDAAELALGRQLALVGTLQAVVLAILGWRIYRALLFPLLYLWLMVPAADVLLPSLQTLATESTVASLNLLGLPTTHQGVLITAAGKTYAIVEECTALDLLLGALAFSLVYAYVFYRRMVRRIAFVALALAAALVANVVRTTSIIFLTNASEGRLDLAEDHQLYGWAIFLATLLVLMLGGLPFREDLQNTTSGSETDRATATTRGDRHSLTATAMAVVLLASLAPIYAHATGDLPAVSEDLALCAPAPQGDWRFSPEKAVWQGFAPTADLRVSQSYARGVGDAAQAMAFVAYYWRQRPGAELISWQNRIADNDDWLVLSSRQRTVELEGQAIAVTEARLRAEEGEQRLVWHWYWVDDRYTSSQSRAKLAQAKATLLGGEQRAAFVALSTPFAGDIDEARARLQSLTATGLSLSSALRRAGAHTCPTH